MNTKHIDKAAAHYKRFCEALGIDVSSDDTKGTPMRVARMYANEYTRGNRGRDFKCTKFSAITSDLVCVVGMRFVSLCSHHHQLFTGYAHFGYVPDEKIVGLSKIPRTIKWLSQKPSVQETLTKEVLDELVVSLRPKYAALCLIATHNCMACRGVHDYESKTVTTRVFAAAGSLEEYRGTHTEFMGAVNMWGTHVRG